MNKHTEGPWQKQKVLCGGKDCFYITDSFQDDVCDLYYKSHTEDDVYHTFPNAEANAQLISAAPELLEALECLKHTSELLVQGKPVRDLDEVMSYAEKAIAKAKGEDDE